jgi:hypothetical protein
LEREEVRLEQEKLTYLVSDLRRKCAQLQASLTAAQQARKPAPTTEEKATQV